MERVRDREPPRRDLAAGEHLRHLLDRLRGAGQHRLLGPVVRGDLDSSAVRGHDLLDLARRCEHREHRPLALRQGAHQAPAFDAQAKPVLAAQCARGARRGVLAQAVAA